MMLNLGNIDALSVELDCMIFEKTNITQKLQYLINDTDGPITRFRKTKIIFTLIRNKKFEAFLMKIKPQKVQK